MDSNRTEADVLPNYTMEMDSKARECTSDLPVDPRISRPVMIAIINRRVLDREVLTLALAATDSRFGSRTFADIGEWELSPDRNETSLILLTCDAGSTDQLSPGDELQALVDNHPDTPVVMMGEDEDPRHIAGILMRGVRGYIPTSVSLRVAVGAFGLAIAGGTFVPASALQISALEQPERPLSVYRILGLSDRQAAVAEAVALGKPNKIIAYEMRLCESTVKVHIRGIMRKMQARNRTEIAFKLHAAKNGSAPSRRSNSVRDRAA